MHIYHVPRWSSLIPILPTPLHSSGGRFLPFCGYLGHQHAGSDFHGQSKRNKGVNSSYERDGSVLSLIFIGNQDGGGSSWRASTWPIIVTAVAVVLIATRMETCQLWALRIVWHASFILCSFNVNNYPEHRGFFRDTRIHTIWDQNVPLGTWRQKYIIISILAPETLASRLL